jgi:tetratricopeptide (TPR) repeat protein
MRRLILIVLLIFTVVAPAYAQEATQEAPVVPSVNIDDALDRSEDAAERAERAASDAQQSADTSKDAVDQAFNLLGVFEAIGFLVTVVGGVAAVLGVTRLISAQNELTEARKRFDKELEEAKERLEEETKQKEAAFDALRQELKRNTGNATLALSYLPLGESQYKSGDFVGALDIYQRALNLDGNNPIIHYRMGYVYTQSGKLDDAERHLKRALEIDQDFAPALAVLGYAYRRKGEKMEQGIERDEMLNRAEYMLQQALKRAPRLVDDDGESWWGSLGGLYRRRGQIDQAIYAYRKAAEVDPNSSYAFSNLALLYVQQGESDKMIQTYHQVERLSQAEVQADVDNYWAYADLLTSRLALKKFDAAESTLPYVFTTAPVDSPYALEVLIDTLERLAKVLESDHALRVKQYIERIQSYAQEQAKTRMAVIEAGD